MASKIFTCLYNGSDDKNFNFAVKLCVNVFFPEFLWSMVHTFQSLYSYHSVTSNTTVKMQIFK